MKKIKDDCGCIHILDENKILHICNDLHGVSIPPGQVAVRFENLPEFLSISINIDRLYEELYESNNKEV